jgi:hypothetical protein
MHAFVIQVPATAATLDLPCIWPAHVTPEDRFLEPASKNRSTRSKEEEEEEKGRQTGSRGRRPQRLEPSVSKNRGCYRSNKTQLGSLQPDVQHYQ